MYHTQVGKLEFSLSLLIILTHTTTTTTFITRKSNAEVNDLTGHVMTYKLLELGHDAQNSSATVDWTIWTTGRIELRRGRYVHPYTTQLNPTQLNTRRRVELSWVELLRHKPSSIRYRLALRIFLHNSRAFQAVKTSAHVEQK